MNKKSVKATVKPELLVWARESACLSVDDVAAKIKLPKERIEAWESGEESCTIPQLRKLAECYKRPLAVLYLPQPPKDFDALRDFRRLPAQIDYEESPELASEIRWAHQIREIAREVFDLAGFDMPDFDLKTRPGDNPVGVASRIRRAIEMTIEEQQTWTDHYQAMGGWRTAVENAGVICIQFTGVSVQEARGFSISAGRLPVIAVNAKDAPPARIFSMMHELTHLMLGESGKCDMHEAQKSHSDVDRVEVFCNRVAGETLVPENDLRRTEIVRMHRQGKDWTALELSELSKRYNVSEEVIVRRLLALGMTTYEFYRRRRDSYIRRAEMKASTGGDYYRNKKTKLGKPLIFGVMSALQQGRITANDASDYLDVKVPKLRRLLQAAIG